ncbi:MAG: sigma-54 dependent transcriptional regulator [Pseudomonadota bacterium]
MDQGASVMVVEDDHTLREALCDTIEFAGYAPVAAENGLEALCALERQTIDLIISDVQMEQMDGHGLLKAVRSRRPEVPFVMMTAHGSVAGAVSAMRNGATEYLQKPFEAEVLLNLVEQLPAAHDSVTVDDTKMIIADPATRSLYTLADRVAGSDATVLIAGESGSGKEVLAHYIHRRSDRCDTDFLAVNCAAIPESMLESMLFGYEKGAYTGAHQARAGKFEQANGGTLLLDEISEMELGLQAKLLRVLQEREVERLGGSRPIPLDVRVIATTNRDLSKEVEEGRFREDLYYRLNVIPLHHPPLRERPQDVLPLARYFLSRYATTPAARFSDAAEQTLLNHAWPGNVRELDNAVQRSALLANSDVLEASDLLLDAELGAPAGTKISASPASVSVPVLEGDLKQREQALILESLKRNHGNRKKTAAHLGISPRTLRYKLARLREQGVVFAEA